MRKNLALIGLAVLLAVLPGCAKVFEVLGKPEVTSVRPRITGIDLEGIAMAFAVDVQNPYPFVIKSPKLRYALDIEGTELLSSTTDTDVRLPANNVGTITLPVRLAYSKLWSTVQKLSKAKRAAYKLHGAVLLDAMGKSYELPVSHTGTFPILRPPKFSNFKVNFSDVSLRSAKVTVQADVQNPNVFALGIKNLGYQLALGSVSVGDLVASTADKIEPDKSGKVTLTGQISAASALLKVIRGASIGTPKLAPSGAIETPYGPVKLGE